MKKLKFPHVREDFHLSLSPCEGGLRGDFFRKTVLVIPAQAGIWVKISYSDGSPALDPRVKPEDDSLGRFKTVFVIPHLMRNPDRKRKSPSFFESVP